LGQIIITVEVPIDTANGTTFTNTATITSTETNPVTTSETTTIESKPVLAISKDVQTTHYPAQPGDTATYTITYGNTGNLTSTNTFIVDAIPQNTRFIVGSVTAPSGVTVQYSSDNGATWTYTPVAGSDGTDPNVTHIKWTVGSLAPRCKK
jgi:conserved repeat domain